MIKGIRPFLIPFYKEIMFQQHDPDTFKHVLPFLFQQDNAPSHAGKVVNSATEEGTPLFEHIGNSPDMNAIEGAWMPMRIAITKDRNSRIL
jgi:hypothetical protein